MEVERPSLSDHVLCSGWHPSLGPRMRSLYPIDSNGPAVKELIQVQSIHLAVHEIYMTWGAPPTRIWDSSFKLRRTGLGGCDGDNAGAPSGGRAQESGKVHSIPFPFLPCLPSYEYAE